MRSAGSPDVLEYRRSLAVQRVAEGYSTEEAADFLGIDPSSVRRWLAAYRRYGGDGLTAQPVPGRLPKLTTTQEKIVLRWLSDPPHRVRLHHRPVVRSAPGPADRARVRRPLPPQLPEHLAPAARVHAAKAPARAPRTGRRGDCPVAGRGLAAHQTESPPPRCVPAADGRKRAADGPVAATQLGTTGPPVGVEVQGWAPGEGVGGGGVVAAAVAGPPASGLPDADQRLLQQRGGGRVPRLRCARVARSGDRYLGWREHAQGRPDPGVGGGVPGALGHRALARACAGVDAGGVPVAVAEVRTAVQFRTAGCPPLERGDGP